MVEGNAVELFINYKSKKMETQLIIGLVFLALTLWIWALIDVTKSRFKSTSLRTKWLFVILFFPLAGSMFYFQFSRNQKERTSHKFQPKFPR